MALGLPSTSFGFGQVFRRSGVEEGAGAAEPSVAPSAPKITARMLWDQFRLDVQGKEVQRAATYSYTWLADQVGHICLGILLAFLATALLASFGWGGPEPAWRGFIVTIVAVSAWEIGAYVLELRGAKGPFPLDWKLLGRNALVAWGYMALGGVLGYLFHTPEPRMILWAIFLGLVIAIGLAPYWLRQKIVWQKAGLPYLFRLANAEHLMEPQQARQVVGLVSAMAPPDADPQQILIAGPVNSGRTSFASGLGTEFAFRDRKVRYLSFDRLVEFATGTNFDNKPLELCDEFGPVNVSYWPWPQAQILIIDDISPILESAPTLENLTQFSDMLGGPLQCIREYLADKHTIWILGNVGSEAELGAFADSIAAFCSADGASRNRENTVRIQLGRAGEGEPKRAKVMRIEGCAPAPARTPGLTARA